MAEIAQKKREEREAKFNKPKDVITNARRLNRYKGKILNWRKEGYSYRKIQRHLRQCHLSMDLHHLYDKIKEWEVKFAKEK